LGKAEAADSVPGPGPEKKTENGVWLDSGDALSESEPAGKTAGRIEVRGFAPAPAPRTLTLATAALTLGAANSGTAIPGAGWSDGFGTDDAEIWLVVVPASGLPVRVSTDE